MLQVGDELIGYKVIETDGDWVRISTPYGFELAFSRTGITGGLREVLGLIGIQLP